MTMPENTVPTTDARGILEFTMFIYEPRGKIIDIPGFIKFTIPETLRFWNDEINVVIPKLVRAGVKRYTITYPPTTY